MMSSDGHHLSVGEINVSVAKEDNDDGDEDSYSDHSLGTTNSSTRHGGGSSSTGAGGGGFMDYSKKEKRPHGSIIIGKAETSAVARSKFALLALLTMMTVCVSTLVYSYGKQHELTIFHENFVDVLPND